MFSVYLHICNKSPLELFPRQTFPFIERQEEINNIFKSISFMKFKNNYFIPSSQPVHHFVIKERKLKSS